MSKITIRPMEPEDWDAVSRIYLEGIATEHATFQTTCPPYAAWDASHTKDCRLVLLVDEDGRMKCKAANQKATQLAPADVTANGKLPIVGAAVLMFQRGDELLGFTKHVADTICSEWLA